MPLTTPRRTLAEPLCPSVPAPTGSWTAAAVAATSPLRHGEGVEGAGAAGYGPTSEVRTCLPGSRRPTRASQGPQRAPDRHTAVEGTTERRHRREGSRWSRTWPTPGKGSPRPPPGHFFPLPAAELKSTMAIRRIGTLRVLADDCPCGQSNDDPVRQIDHQQVGRAFSGCIMHCAIPASAVTVQETHHETSIPDPFRRADHALAIWTGLEGARL